MALQSLCISQTQQESLKKPATMLSFSTMLFASGAPPQPITCKEFKSQPSISFLSSCFNKVMTVGEAQAMWVIWNHSMDLIRHQFPLIYDLRNLMSEGRVDVEMQVTE
ncbi:hypothetical protein PS2_000452 [Malus domestica]